MVRIITIIPYMRNIKLSELGIKNMYVYCGGLFEWLCLQDIYGEDEFPTTIKELEFLNLNLLVLSINYI